MNRSSRIYVAGGDTLLGAALLRTAAKRRAIATSSASRPTSPT